MSMATQGEEPTTKQLDQSYGIGERLIREGNQMHMAVRGYSMSSRGEADATLGLLQPKPVRRYRGDFSISVDSPVDCRS